ncbi:hypothetical protein IAT38_005711 [Cryptococcus sp. DSM 104549]
MSQSSSQLPLTAKPRGPVWVTVDDIKPGPVHRPMRAQIKSVEPSFTPPTTGKASKRKREKARKLRKEEKVMVEGMKELSLTPEVREAKILVEGIQDLSLKQGAKRTYGEFSPESVQTKLAASIKAKIDCAQNGKPTSNRKQLSTADREGAGESNNGIDAAK